MTISAEGNTLNPNRTRDILEPKYRFWDGEPRGDSNPNT